LKTKIPFGISVFWATYTIADATNSPVPACIGCDFTITGIEDVRGQRLFLGIEPVDEQLNPLTEKTDYLINRMKEFGVLMNSDVANHNMIKIKPPIVFTK
jgi:hypothetical protein